jgi:hypothetical protein
MNPNDPNVAGNASPARTDDPGLMKRCRVRRRPGSPTPATTTERFLVWLKEETIAITAEHFGSDGSRPVVRLVQPRLLARTA